MFTSTTCQSSGPDVPLTATKTDVMAEIACMYWHTGVFIPYRARSACNGGLRRVIYFQLMTVESNAPINYHQLVSPAGGGQTDRARVCVCLCMCVCVRALACVSVCVRACVFIMYRKPEELLAIRARRWTRCGIESKEIPRFKAWLVNMTLGPIFTSRENCSRPQVF